MNQSQLDNLNEEEIAMLFYIVNVLEPITIPKMEFDMKTIKWIRHDQLQNNLVKVFASIKPEGYGTYCSLLEKLGVKFEMKDGQPEHISRIPIIIEELTTCP